MSALTLGLAALAGLVFGCCALLGLRDRTWWSSSLVVLGPAIDAALTAWVLDWLGLGPVLTVLAAAMVGLASSLFMAVGTARRCGAALFRFRPERLGVSSVAVLGWDHWSQSMVGTVRALMARHARQVPPLC